MVATIILLQNK